MNENQAEKCSLCNGAACEEGCGTPLHGCRFAEAGPDSHKVCVRCGGSGLNLTRRAAQ